MPDSKVRTIRPLSLTSDVLLRPVGPLDADCAGELRDALSYVLDRPGGPIVVDCAGVTALSDEGATTLRSLGETALEADRVFQLRHLTAELRTGRAALADPTHDGQSA